MNEKEIIPEKTSLGFEDITKYLNKETTIQIQKYDVIRNVLVDMIKEELHSNIPSTVGYFLSKEQGIRGRVFTFSELIEPMTTYDLIIQNIKKDTCPTRYNLDTQIYHDFSKGEKIKIYADRKDKNDPSFLLFNKIRGFIPRRFDPYLYETIKKGDLLSVQVEELIHKDNRRFVIARPLEIIEWVNEEN